MKKFLVIICFTVVIFVSILTNSKIQAENKFVLYPSYVRVNNSAKYNLTLENNIDSKANVQLSAAILERRNDLLVPLSESQQSELKIDLNKFLEIKSQSLEIAGSSKESVEIKISELSLFPKNYYLAVKASVLDTQQEDVSLGADLYSIIINENLDAEDIAGINVLLEIDTHLKLDKIIFTNSIDIKTLIQNNSAKNLIGTGSIIISKETKAQLKAKDGEKLGLNSIILQEIPLTRSLQSDIKPSSNFLIQSKFKDSSPFYKRVGFVNVEQKITLNGVDFIRTDKVFLLPWELILVVVITAIIIIFYLRSNNPLRKIRLRARLKK